MEKERFTRIHKIFNYTPKSIFTNRLTNLAYGIGMIVVPLVYLFGIRIRRAQILSAEVLSTIFIIGGSLLLLFTFFNIWTAHALVSQGGTIRIEDGRVTYPVVKKRKVMYQSFLISDIQKIQEDEEEHQCNVDLPDKYIVFEMKYFDSLEHYEEFRTLLG